ASALPGLLTFDSLHPHPYISKDNPTSSSGTMEGTSRDGRTRHILREVEITEEMNLCRFFRSGITRILRRVDQGDRSFEMKDGDTVTCADVLTVLHHDSAGHAGGGYPFVIFSSGCQPCVGERNRGGKNSTSRRPNANTGSLTNVRFLAGVHTTTCSPIPSRVSAYRRL